MQNAIYTKSPIFKFLHHLKARDRLAVRRYIRQNAIYTPSAAEFFKARYTRVALVVSYESRARLVRVFPHELKF